MNSLKIRKSAASLIGILLLIYVAYQFHMATKKGIATEMVTYSAVEESIQVQALAVREETVLSADYNGLLSFMVADGTNIEKGGVIAQSYPGESGVSAQMQTSRLDSEIRELEKLLSPGDSHISNPGLIGKQIYTALDELCKEVQSGDFSTLSTKRDAFHLALSRKNIIAGLEQTEDYSARLEELKQRRESFSQLAENRTGEVTAPVAGYFSASYDGYEAVLQPSDLPSLSVGEAKELMTKPPSGAPSGSIGKIITGFNWYFVAVLSESDAMKMHGKQNVEIEMPFSGGGKIPAHVVSRSYDAATKETAFVLECTTMNAEIAKIRSEAIKITTETYQGLLVNERSIFFEDFEQKTQNPETGETEITVHKKVRGVYIKNGARLKFVQIFSDKTMNGYAICKANLSEEEAEMLVTDSTISLYDEVIVGGTDLYDGKLIL